MAHKEVQRQNTIDEIKNAARRQIEREGLSGVSMRAIARSMEISAPALYRYFESRDAIVRAIITDAGENMVAALETGLIRQPPGNHSQRFWEIATKFQDWAHAYPVDFQLAIEHTISRDLATVEYAQKANHRAIKLILDIFWGAYQDGILKPISAEAQAFSEIQTVQSIMGEDPDHAIPPQVFYTALVAWSRMLGLVMLDLHIRSTQLKETSRSIFQQEMTDFLKSVGLETEPLPIKPSPEQARPARLKIKRDSSDDVHVVFGSGALGLAVVKELVSRGKQVRMVNRGRQVAVPEGVEWMVGDAFQMEFTRKACQNAAVIYQCAQPARSEWLERYAALNTAILNGAAAKGAKFIYADNLLAYGAVDGPIHEGLPLKPQSQKAQIRARVSEMILTAHRSGRVRGAIGRSANFFGPHVIHGILGERLITPIMQGKTVSVIGNPDIPHTFAYIEDIGKSLVLLGERDEALGQIWHLPHPPPLTQRQFITLLCKEAGTSPRIQVLSRQMLTIQAIFSADAREQKEILYQFEKPLWVDSSRFEKVFSQSATPLPEAARRTVEWFLQV